MADKNIFKLEGKSQEQVKEAFLEFWAIPHEFLQAELPGWVSWGASGIYWFPAFTFRDDV